MRTHSSLQRALYIYILYNIHEHIYALVSEDHLQARLAQEMLLTQEHLIEELERVEQQPKVLVRCPVYE